MRPELYQDMLADLSEFAKAGDALGYDSIGFTEHHFHIEGFEVSPNPIMLDLYLAMQTGAESGWDSSAWCCRRRIRSAWPRTSRCSTT